MRPRRRPRRQGSTACSRTATCWPLGNPGKPALSPYPLLGAVAAKTARIALGTLVARVGLESDGALIGELLALDALAPGRFIAGIGTGDSMSAAENLAYGVPFESARERLRQQRIGHALVAEDVRVWVGGGSPATSAIARELASPVNLWASSAADVEEAARSGPVTWGGSISDEVAVASRQLAELRDAGASWAVLAVPQSIPTIVAAARAAGLELLD